ncbi:MAG: hypothetical protein RL336_233 [Pseudomonadota bacterium]
MQLDRINKKILSVLQVDARITNHALAEKVGISPSACLNRVRKLESDGVIGPFLTNVNLPVLCRSITVIATATVKDQSTETFNQFLHEANSMDEVVECYVVSGNFDVFLKVVAADMPSYNLVIDHLVDSLPGLVHISSHVVMNTSKPFAGYPLQKLVD